MKKLIKLSTAICGAILVVLGFSTFLTSCMKYGVPPDEIVSGKVTDKVSGKPIKGIKVTNTYYNPNVVIPMYGTVPNYYDGNSAFTDANGNYRIYGDDNILPYLHFEDVDGAENNLYKDTTVNVDVNNIALTPKN